MFNELPSQELDHIMLANAAWPAFKKSHDNAVNITIGTLLDPQTNSPWRPDTVQAAYKQAARLIERHHRYGYQSPHGHDAFLERARQTFLGTEDPDIPGYQAFGGSGALSLAKDILVLLMKPGKDGKRTLFLDPGYPNHLAIFGHDFNFVTYPHVDYEAGTYNHRAALEALKKVPDGSAALLQVGGYNDDGLDRTNEQWDEILELAAEKNIVVILDAAYLGLVKGLAQDMYPIKQAIKLGLFAFVCLSMSKNMGLYNERLGAVFIANAKRHLGAKQAKNMNSTVERVIRRTSSTPPLLVAETGYLVLNNPAFFDELESGRLRLLATRNAFANIVGTHLPMVKNGGGMFTKLFEHGFSERQQEYLHEEGILVLPSSRINLGGLKPDQIERVGTAILRSVELT